MSPTRALLPPYVGLPPGWRGGLPTPPWSLKDHLLLSVCPVLCLRPPRHVWSPVTPDVLKTRRRREDRHLQTFLPWLHTKKSPRSGWLPKPHRRSVTSQVTLKVSVRTPRWRRDAPTQGHPVGRDDWHLTEGETPLQRKDTTLGPWIGPPKSRE